MKVFFPQKFEAIINNEMIKGTFNTIKAPGRLDGKVDALSGQVT
jgi:hypothetical protein